MSHPQRVSDGIGGPLAALCAFREGFGSGEATSVMTDKPGGLPGGLPSQDLL